MNNQSQSNQPSNHSGTDKSCKWPPNPIWHCDVCQKVCKKADAKEEITMKTCGRCRAVQYCSRECQKKDWKKGGHQHKCGKYAEGCYVYIPSWDVSIHWLSVKERRERFQELNSYHYSYEEALDYRMSFYDFEFDFLQMVDDEREDEDRSCCGEGGDSSSNRKEQEDHIDNLGDDVESWEDRPLIPSWKNQGYASEDDFILHEVDGVRNMEEYMCDIYGVPRLEAIGNDVDRKLTEAGLKYLGYKNGRDFEIGAYSVKIGTRVLMSNCSGHMYSE